VVRFDKLSITVISYVYEDVLDIVSYFSIDPPRRAPSTPRSGFQDPP